MIDHASRRSTMLLAAVAVSAALSLVAMGATLVSRAHSTEDFKQQTSSQCQAIESLKGAIRLVFQDNLEALQRRQAEIDPGQYRIARDYYLRQLQRFAKAQCP